VERLDRYLIVARTEADELGKALARGVPERVSEIEWRGFAMLFESL
jgi:hypothetical protein